MVTLLSILLCLLALAAPLHAQQQQPKKATEALTVRHSPNPVHGYYSREPAPQWGFYKWRYRTEVKNNLDVPLRITHFEGYRYEKGNWIPGTIARRTLTSADFTAWYADGDSVIAGWIPPGKVAVNADNWTTSPPPAPPRVKWIYAAEDSKGNIYHAESEIVFIPTPAKYHAGDPAAAGRPEFDDSEWGQIKDGVYDKWQGIGWFRYVVEVDSSLWHEPLGLLIEAIFGAVEFYLDGKLVHRVGRVVASKTAEEALIMWDPVPISFHPSPGHAKGRSKHLIAIRHSSFFWDSPTWSGQRWSLFWRIGDLKQMSANRAQILRRVTFHQMLLMGVFLAFALLHLLLFLFYPSHRGRTNLYFAVFTTALAMTVYFYFQHLFTIDAGHYFLYKNFLLLTSATLCMLCGIRFTYLLIYPKLPKIFILFCVVGFGLTLWHWFRPFIMAKYLPLFYAVCCVELLRALAVSRLKKREMQFEGSWIILLGLMPLALVGGYYFLATDELGLVPVPWDFNEFPAPYYAALILLLSMSVFLSRNFAQTNKNLEAQLIQVKALSEKAIQQERERAQLEAEHARKTQELEEARQLQLAMLPKTVPKLPHLEIAVYSKPATEVGGDYYDFHLDGNGTLTVAIGDATGHGMKAGTLVSVTKGLFKSLAHKESLPLILQKMSRALDSMNLGYLYMAMMLVKYRDNKITISAAGMPPALLHKADLNQVDEILIKGLPLGGFPNFKYQQAEIEFRAGDTLVLMSDGLPEMFNEAGEILDYPAMKKLVEEVPHASPQAIIDYLVTAGEKWANGRPQEDDVTFVVIKTTSDFQSN